MHEEEKQKTENLALRWTSFRKSPLTEGDETRAVSIDLLEELGHVQIGHTKSRAQQSGELLSGDSLILI